MAGTGNKQLRMKKTKPLYNLANGQEEQFRQKAKDVTEKQRREQEENRRWGGNGDPTFSVKDSRFVTFATNQNRIDQEEVDEAFSRAMENSGNGRLYQKVRRIQEGSASRNDTQYFSLKSSRGAKYMLEGESVLELDFAGTGATELMRGMLEEKFAKKYDEDGNELPDDDDEESNAEAPLEDKEESNWFGRALRYIFSRIPGIWSTKQRNAHVKSHNEAAAFNREQRRVAYGEAVTLKKDGKNKTFAHIKRKDAINTDTGATKTRYTMAGPNIINIGEYQLDNLEEYALALGSEWLAPKLTRIADRIGDGEVPPDEKKLHVMFQGHSRGSVAATMAAMRLNKWLHDHFEEKIANLVQFDLTLGDPVPGKMSRTGIREKAEIDTKAYYDKDGVRTTDLDKAKYRSLGGQQNSTVVYCLRTLMNHLYTPQQIIGAKRVILSVRDHNGIFSWEKTEKFSEEKTTHRSPFLDLENEKAYRGSGLNEMEEGLYFADDHNILHKVENLNEFQVMCRDILEGEALNVQTKRQFAIDSVAKAWFEAHPPRDEEPADEALQKLRNRQQALKKRMKLTDKDDIRGIEEQPGAREAKMEIWSKEKYNSRTKAEREAYDRRLRRYQERQRKEQEKAKQLKKEAILREKINKSLAEERRERAKRIATANKKKEARQKKAAEKQRRTDMVNLLRADRDLGILRERFMSVNDEIAKEELGRIMLNLAGKALLGSKQFGEDIRKEHSPVRIEDEALACKLALGELGPEEGREEFYSELEKHEAALKPLQEGELLAAVIKAEVLPLMRDFVGEDPLFSATEKKISDDAKQAINKARTDWEAYKGNIYQAIGMSPLSELLNDYRNPAVLKQFRDQVDDRMKKENISRAQAESAVLEERRRGIQTKPQELTKKNSLTEILPEDKLKENAEKKIVSSGVPEAQWKEKGGCTWHYVLDAKEAAQIAQKSGGFLCAVKLETKEGEVPQPGLRELKPSLPSTVRIGDKTVMVRRTYKLLIKAYMTLITNPDGSLRTDKEAVRITNLFDELTGYPINSEKDEQKRSNILKEVFGPAMQKILEEKNVSKEDLELLESGTLNEVQRKAVQKRIEVSKGLAKFEVRDALDDIINMVKTIPNGALIPSEVGMGTTMVGLAKLVRMDPQKLMDRVMEEVTIAGKKPSREEVARAVEEIYDDIEKAFASLKKVRDLDLESEEIPVPNSCSANALFISNVQHMKTGETKRSNKYLANYFVLAHPEKTRQYLIKNMDILVAGEDTDDKKKDQYLEALKKMNFGDASYKEMYEKDIPYETYVESLNPDVRQLMTIAAEFTKYVYHFATRIMADEKDGVWTTEAFAAENTQIMVEPFTFNAGIGHYRGRSKEVHDKVLDKSTHILEGFNDYYNGDNPFISTRVDVIKCRIKRLMKNEKL